MENACVIVEVVAGILPGTPMPELSKRWAITSEQWNAQGAKHDELLAEVNGRAQGYAGLLMLQPDRLNWVRTEWMWL